MRRIQGSITIFLSLILLSILALICVCLESARAAGLQASAQMCAVSSLQSVLAGYDRILWEQYGLFFFSDSDREGTRLVQIAKDYAEKNGNAEASGLDWFRLANPAVEAEHLTFATDSHGDIFRQAVSDYMKTAGAAESAEMLFEKLGLTDSAGELTETGEKWEASSKEEELDVKNLLQEYDDLKEEQAEAEAQPPAEEQVRETAGMSREQAEPVVQSVMNTIRSIGRFGLLGFVAEDAASLSNDVLSREELPSSLTASEREGDGNGRRDPGVLDYPLFYEYVVRNLDCYTSEQRKGCQVEYVITGKNTERKCVSSVAARLFAIRYLMDQTMALTEPKLQKEAETLAVAALGWTGIVPMVEGLKMILLLAMAMGESALDVRTLFSGGRIPLKKDASSWRMSLLHLADTLGDLSKKSEEDEDGLSYEDYMRILLLLNNQEEIVYRTMDVIQQEICRTEPDFRFASCIYSGEIRLTAEAQSIFPLIPAISEYSFTGTAGGGYQPVVK